MKTIIRQGLFFLIILDSFAGILRSQVIIKERVVIDSVGSVDHPEKQKNVNSTSLSKLSNNTLVSGFKMPKTGQLQVYYTYADRLDKELPENAALITHFLKGDSSTSDLINRRFSYTSWFRQVNNWCSGGPEWRQEYDYTNTGSGEEVYLYNAGIVAKDDTVQFFYVSDDIQTGDSVLYAIYYADTVRLADNTVAGWNVTFGNYDYCISDFTDALNVFIGVNDAPEIMLGETKYFQAVPDPADATKLIFKEMSETSGWTPGGQLAQFTVTAETPTDKLGAYYEFKDNDGYVLAGDMIRLIGRYWTQYQTYKVRLSARSGSRTGSIVIEVKKPAKLLAAGQSPDYINVKDVFANPSGPNNLNLDELIIKYAGENGIPPQNIKGQMLKETSFKPAWRYEPFADAKYQKLEDGDTYFDEGMPFVVTETSMGGDLPNTHTNVYSGRQLLLTPYIDEPVYIGSYVTQHWDNYVRHKSGDEPDQIIGSRTLTDRWKELYKEAKGKRSLTDAQARTEAHTKLKNEINNANTTIGKRFGVIAQTRKWTSYGFIQMLYITAADNTFSKETDNRYGQTDITPYADQNDANMFPEKLLNEQDFFMPRYCDFLLKKLNSKFPGRIPFYEWEGGFNAKWKSAIQKYNPGEANYAIDVLNNAQLFVPSKQ